MSSPYKRFLAFDAIKARPLRACALSLNILLLSSAFLGLSGCEEEEDNPFAPACPALEIPEHTADNFRYAGSETDLKHLITHTEITTIHGDCQTKKGTHEETTKVRITLELLQQYGPAYKADQPKITLPYFIAVVKNGQIIDKKIFSAEIKSEPSKIMQKTNTILRVIDLPTGDNPQISPYTLEVGFQLSHDALSYNRQHLKVAQFKDYTPNNLEITSNDEDE